MSYSVILPTLNEAGHIVQLVDQISETLLKTNEKFEIIIVDDSSTDRTPELCELEEKRKYIFFSRTGQKIRWSINLIENQSMKILFGSMLTFSTLLNIFIYFTNM